MKRRRRAAYITLPGGAKLTFAGYLPPTACLECGMTCPAAAYVKAITINRTGRRELNFGDWCMQCEPPHDTFPDLRGVRPKSNYYAIDDSGKRRAMGWRERDRVRGVHGPELPLELMGLRKMADGVYRPQPKLDRRSREEQVAHPREPKQYAPVRDPQRSFKKSSLEIVITRQQGLCDACGTPFTEDDPAVADHDLPFADGGPTDLVNCRALHRSCNAKKGRQTGAQYRRARKLFDPPV